MSFSSATKPRVLNFTILFINALFLLTVYAENEREQPNVISNCYIRDFNNIRCFGSFNVSNILYEQRQLSNPKEFWSERFSGLEIFNSTIEVIDEKMMEFHGYKFETILIENTPNLKSIHPQAFIYLKEHLTDFRAINTSLPQYNDWENDQHKDQNPFHDFTKLMEVYIGEQSHCPGDEAILFPCKCEYGHLPRTVPFGLFGSSWGISTAFGNTTRIKCESKNMTGDDLKQIFLNISRSDHTPKHFDVLTISRTTNLTGMPSDVFSNVTITTIWMTAVDNLKSIHRNAFSASVARSIQVLDIDVANFTAADSIEVNSIFRALSSLTNIRILRLSKCGIPYVPAYAFVPENPQTQLNNLRYLTLSFDRKRHPSGIKSVGSYAFSGAPNLIELGLLKNYIEKFDSFAFAFNQTSNRTLTIYIGGNPFNDTYGLKPNALSGSQRSVHIKFEIDSFAASDTANNPSLNFMPENVFRPFIEENPNNYFEVDYYNVDVWCDCGIKWMFDDNGYLKKNVQNGLRIHRVEDDTVGSEPLSIQCKAESSFECLPNCLAFPLAELIHCGGNEPFDVKQSFDNLALVNGTKNFTKLIFSSKEIQELPRDAFGNFQFQNIHLEGCWNLSSIHPAEFGASTNTVKELIAANTNLTYYPNFALFPNLEIIQLDDSHPYHINSSTFDFTHASRHPKLINIFMDNGTIEPATFDKLNNETSITLTIGERKDCSTLACLISCKASELKLDRSIFKPFLEANPQNKINTKCYLQCSCELKWMYESWKNVESQIDIWVEEYFGSEFYCLPSGANLETEDNFFGVDPTQFDYGTYFSKNCK